MSPEKPKEESQDPAIDEDSIFSIQIIPETPMTFEKLITENREIARKYIMPYLGNLLPDPREELTCSIHLFKLALLNRRIHDVVCAYVNIRQHKFPQNKIIEVFS